MKKSKYYVEIKIVAVFISILMCITVTRFYVSSYYNEGQGYQWEANAGTTKGLPIIFAKCDFHYTGYYENNCNSHVMLYAEEDTDNWLSCGDSGLGERKDLYPNNLNILYYSFNESKFYEGKFELDYDRILTVAEKMRKAIIEEQEARTESISFKAKVYPKGKIVFSMESYLSTSIGEVVIAVFQAKPVSRDWSVFDRINSEDDSGISNNTSVAIQRSLLLNKYNWQIEIMLPKECKMRNLDVTVYGNKSLKMDTIKNSKIPTYGNFVYLPQRLNLSWQRNDTIELNTSFDFDEEEIIKAFEPMTGDAFPIKMTLILKDDTEALQIVLEGKDKNIELKNTKPTEIQQERIYDYF